ncbi:hypothetical protein niasHS_004016 [Heterodera schachtii]|uniref:Meckelin n=1 Tax=Heterodera schachtii TaxID=97005 RepID=A0ABD2JUF4_HETSC
MDCDQCPEGMAPAPQSQNECQCESAERRVLTISVDTSPTEGRRQRIGCQQKFGILCQMFGIGRSSFGKFGRRHGPMPNFALGERRQAKGVTNVCRAKVRHAFAKRTVLSLFVPVFPPMPFKFNRCSPTVSISPPLIKSCICATPNLGAVVPLTVANAHIWLICAHCKIMHVSLIQMTEQQQQKQRGSVFPQLFYANIDASIEIFRASAIEAIFELVPRMRNSRLDIVAMAYSLNGTFIGQMLFERVFLLRCPSFRWNGLAAKAALHFGTFFRQKCFWSESAHSETVLFELYIRFEDTNGEIKLFPVPILNEDIRGDQYTGWYPNRLDQLRRDSRVVLTKRFYLVDKQSVVTVTDQQAEKRTDQLIRSPERITLHIHLQMLLQRAAFLCRTSKFLTLKLFKRSNWIQAVTASPATAEVALLPSMRPTFRWNSNLAFFYHADSYPYDKTVEVVMATACSVAALWAAVRAYSWGRRSGKLIIDASTILKLVLYAADGIGNVFLLVMAIIAVWLTFAYKKQSHLFYVPLAESQEGSFVAYLVSAVALKALSLAHSLVCLTLVQTFFIEKANYEAKEAKGEQKAKDSQHSSVVIWRTYLIANEWNELQLYRKTRLSVQLLTVLFLLDYMEFGNFAKLQPGVQFPLAVDQPSEVVETRMSRFAVDFSFYVAIAMGQWLFQVLIVERVADPFRNFMDLCSVANISVLAMTNPLRGFYIHGRSVHGFADTDMLQMNIGMEIPWHDIGMEIPWHGIGMEIPWHDIGMEIPWHGIGMEIPWHGIGMEIPWHGIGMEIPWHDIGMEIPWHGIGMEIPWHGIGREIPWHGIGMEIPWHDIGKEIPFHLLPGQFMCHARFGDELGPANIHRNVPRAFRERIDQIMATAVANGTISAAVRQGADALDKTTVRMQKIATAYGELNECLKDFVNRVDPKCDYVVTSPRLIEALLGLELSDTSTVGTFSRDRSECEYSSAFLYGEWALLSAELALFCLVDLYWRHRLLAAFVTFLLSAAVRHTVKLYFTHQLAKSSMVDSRFLI